VRPRKFASCLALAAVTTSHAQHAPDNAIVNPDGSRTILRSQQLPEANERRAAWCREHGGVDITNEGDVTLSQGAVDVVVCRRTDTSAPGFSGAYVPQGGPQDRIQPGIQLEKARPFVPEGLPAWTPEALLQPQEAIPQRLGLP